jgi:hypothetical protein
MISYPASRTDLRPVGHLGRYQSDTPAPAAAAPDDRTAQPVGLDNWVRALTCTLLERYAVGILWSMLLV